jgi:hypothetical protein
MVSSRLSLSDLIFFPFNFNGLICYAGKDVGIDVSYTPGDSENARDVAYFSSGVLFGNWN